MKKFLTVALFAIMVVALLGNMALAAPKYVDGEYVGVNVDSKGVTTVIAVAIVDGMISNVEILNQVKTSVNYTFEPGIKAFIEYPGKVVAKQAGDIDSVAGATGSYTSYNAAVKMALDIASGSYKGNVYYGLNRSYVRGGAHTVIEVTLNAKKNKIEALKFITGTTDSKQKNRDTLVENKLTSGYKYAAGVEAMKTFPEKVIKKQSVYVDGVAGATHSNHEFQAALLHALAQAGVSSTFEKH